MATGFDVKITLFDRVATFLMEWLPGFIGLSLFVVATLIDGMIAFSDILIAMFVEVLTSFYGMYAFFDSDRLV